MKIRAKNVKAKIQKDFKKVKAKVGKKVKRGNVTAIKIESKRIIIPLQSLNVEKSTDEKINLDKIIKQLGHYSINNRAAALNDLKIIMENSIHAASYIAMVIAKTMELMFDEDNNIRKLCTDVLTIIFTKFNSTRFEAVASIIISYICSGLTNISRLIRKNTLNVLLCLVNHHPVLLVIQFEKIVEHVLALVNISNQTNTAIGVNKSGQGSVLAIAAAEANMNKGKKNKMEKSTLLVSVLKVLVSLLSNTTGASISKTNHNIKDNADVTINNDSNSIILLGSKKNTSKFIEYKKKGVVKIFVTNDNKGGHAMSDRLPIHLADNLCVRLNDIWVGITASQSNIVPLDVLDVLTEVTSLAIILDNIFQVGTLSSYKILLNSMKKLFPYYSYEASMAVPGSSQELQGLFQIENLNLSICEIIYVNFMHDTTEINTFLVNLIRKLVDQQTNKRQDDGSVIFIGNESNNYSSSVIPKLFSTLQIIINLTYSTHDQIVKILANNNDIFFIVLQSCSDLSNSITIDMIKSKQEAKSIVIAIIKYVSNIIINILWKLNDLQYENDTLNLIPNMIMALLSLIVNCPDELGFLKDNFVSTVLIMVQRNHSPIFSDAHTQLVFKNHKEFYLKSDNINIRYRMLDIFYYLCFDDSKAFYNAVKIVIKCVVSSKVTSDERRYLLRILFERRYELGLNDYIKLLFLSLQYYIKSVNNTNTGSESSKNFKKSHKIFLENANIAHWYGNDVANAILWCSSPELSSINLLKLVKPLLEEFDVVTDKTSIENYLSLLVTITFITRLFTTTSVLCNDDAESLLVNNTLQLLCDCTYEYMTNDMILPTTALISNEHNDLLYIPINLCLHLKFIDGYPITKLLLHAINNNWISYSQFIKEKILKIIYNIVISSETIVTVSRDDLNIFLDNINQKKNDDDNISSLIIAIKTFC